MTALYQQIVQDIIEKIEQHCFHRGEKLPSIRRLSKDYDCSKTTVQQALLTLKHLNRIYAVEKSGYYILEDQEFHDQTVALDPEDFQQLPYEDFRRCLHESLIGRENYLFNYYHQQEGLEELIRSLRGLLMNYSVYCKAEQLVITAGSQQALYILSQLDFGPSRTDILLEKPTYHRMLQLVVQQGLPYQEIERTLDGIDLDDLERRFQTGTIRFFYTIPRLHNPLGTSYDSATRQKIVQLAHRYQVYLIEDDFMADFDADKNPPLHYLDQKEWVVYLKSFTPTLFPALRIGGVALPQRLVAPFLAYKGIIDYDTNLIMQKALSLYIDNGMFGRNSQLLAAQHQQTAQTIQQLLEQTPPPVPYQVQGDLITLALAAEQETAALLHNPFGFHPIKGITQTYWQTRYSPDLPQRLTGFCLLLAEDNRMLPKK